MIPALWLIAALAAPQDPIPTVTLPEAIVRAQTTDPEYVRATGEVSGAAWERRAAVSALFVPSISASVDATKYSTEFFNVGTGQLQSQSVNAQLSAEYDLFSLRKFSELGRSRAALTRAEADALQQRFRTELVTEVDYYGVLRQQELGRVAEARLHRATEAFGVARARVAAGAAVQTDSLQLQLELTQAEVDGLRQSAALRVAQLQLGRRIGVAGPANAAPVDTAPAADLPLSINQAVTFALESGPRYVAARAAEQAAAAQVRAEKGEYLPRFTLGGSHLRFDDSFFPEARNVSALTLSVVLPIWNRGQREIALTRARVGHDVAQAIRRDLERGARRDVTEAYESYTTAQAVERLSLRAVGVAGENYRVQRARYEAGAATILDLLDGQFRLTQAEADLVQSRYDSRLALAQLEAILGRRLVGAGTP